MKFFWYDGLAFAGGSFYFFDYFSIKVYGAFYHAEALRRRDAEIYRAKLCKWGMFSVGKEVGARCSV